MLLGMTFMYLMLGVWFTIIGIGNKYFKPAFTNIIVMIVFYPVIFATITGKE